MLFEYNLNSKFYLEMYAIQVRLYSKILIVLPVNIHLLCWNQKILLIGWAKTNQMELNEASAKRSKEISV